MRSVFLLVMDAMRMTGQCSLMTSGDRTRAGRVPPCSDPSTGSRRTRTISPRRGVVFEGMLDFLFQRVVFAFDLAVDLGHLATALDDRLPKLLAAAAVEPVLKELSD